MIMIRAFGIFWDFTMKEIGPFDVTEFSPQQCKRTDYIYGTSPFPGALSRRHKSQTLLELLTLKK
jgi:hypothetical protein